MSLLGSVVRVLGHHRDPPHLYLLALIDFQDTFHHEPLCGYILSFLFYERCQTWTIEDASVHKCT